MSIGKIKKRNGGIIDYDVKKIYNAVLKAFQSIYIDANNLEEKTKSITDEVESSYNNIEDKVISVEEIQDDVEKALMRAKEFETAKAYILYRKKRSDVRSQGEKLLGVFKDLVDKDSKDSEIKRENANINGDTAMGTMLKFGSEGSKAYYETDLIEPRFVNAHKDGDIHIHDQDFYALTLTCCQIDLVQLLQGGFSTGHGFIREPNDIRTYAALACIAIQANQNDQHGGQSVPNFDFAMAKGVSKTYIKSICKCFDFLDFPAEKIEELKIQLKALLINNESLLDANTQIKIENIIKKVMNYDDTAFILRKALKETQGATNQAMEAVIHNLNTMHSRAGAQVPFSSLNYGTCTTQEGRMVTRAILKATWEGLGNGETPVFPIQIFKVKDGVSGNPEDINYDLFLEACKVSARRLFPNFSFIDAPFNLQYYKKNRPETEVAYMGCRTRVLGNVYNPENQTTYGRGNLSFTSINLPRIAIKASRGEVDFFQELTRIMDLSFDQLLARLEIQSRRRVKNFPFLMGQGIWVDSNLLGMDDEVREIIKNGSISVGFIGLAEAVKALSGKHHGELTSSWDLAYKIVDFMRKKADAKAQETKLNFSLLATPAEGLSGRFVNIDKKKYGIIEGVTDRQYYTNSFHIPVYYKINAFNKIKLEAPFHELTNAGHITYVEMDGDPLKNLDAFMQIVQAMKYEGIGYGAINHAVDRCPVCGYIGIINDICPGCNRCEGEAVLLSSLSKEKQEKILGEYKC